MAPRSDDPNEPPWQVLVVHDSSEERTRVREAVRGSPSPIEVYEAESVLAATEVLRTAQPTCVLVACRLPDGTGLELARDWPDIPFVALASGVTEEERLELVGLGVDDVLGRDELEPGGVFRSIRYAVGRKLHARAMATMARSDRLLSLGRLSANVAHEINNPLAFMLANLDAMHRQVEATERLLRGLREEPALSSALDRVLVEHPLYLSAEEMIQAIGDTIDGAERIAAIVRQLGSFARGSKDAEAASETRLSDVASRACALVRKQVEQRAQVILTVGDDPPFVGRAGQLVQMVTNLVFNAAQAVPDDQPSEHRVWVETRSDADSVELIVEDTGPGFTWRVRQQALDPFFTTKAAGGGSGLGLAIVNDIVRGHGGSIALDNRPGGGARVVVTIPRETGLETSVRDQSSSSDRDPSGPIRILLVDDELAIRRAYVRLLRGHEVVSETATRALERLSTAAASEFDLVLCDVSMPDVDGLTFFEHLGETAPELTSRFAFLTGGALDDSVREALDRSAVPILHKPASKEDILELARDLRRSGGARAPIESGLG